MTIRSSTFDQLPSRTTIGTGARCKTTLYMRGQISKTIWRLRHPMQVSNGEENLMTWIPIRPHLQVSGGNLLGEPVRLSQMMAPIVSQWWQTTLRRNHMLIHTGQIWCSIHFTRVLPSKRNSNLMSVILSSPMPPWRHVTEPQANKPSFKCSTQIRTGVVEAQTVSKMMEMRSLPYPSSLSLPNWMLRVALSRIRALLSRSQKSGTIKVWE